MKNLIAFTGPKESGKSTCANYLANVYNYQTESFARKMKEAVALMFPDVGDLELDKEKTIYVKKPIGTLEGIKGPKRAILKTLGTTWGRNTICPDLWIYHVAESWRALKNTTSHLPDEDYPGMVISDLRFDNEALWVKNEGGIVIQINRPCLPIETNKHESEIGIDPDLVDYVINNDGDFESLFEELYCVLIALEKMKPGLNINSTNVDEQPLSELIPQWANDVFPNRTIKNAIDKLMYEEIPEFMLDQSDSSELADIGILLYDIAYLSGIDLDSAIREKMEINKKRKWKLNEKTGIINHIK